ncbi:hypothetical protein KEH51_03590 [[Brevibacterium] frigoritolerans]|uniref:Phosphoesterase HXTX domain-containing protein n=1 Tax=Peribacillus frigoritolerans TaxID=450367 RepID=A0A941J4M4_9BACI|nr:hypothetical protein [Peribacillus frigoritolerans]
MGRRQAARKAFAIQRKVYNSCIEAGFELDKKPFKPHITLARKFEGIIPFRWRAFARWRMCRISILKQTRLRYIKHILSFPSYEKIFTINLQK